MELRLRTTSKFKRVKEKQRQSLPGAVRRREEKQEKVSFWKLKEERVWGGCGERDLSDCPG